MKKSLLFFVCLTICFTGIPGNAAITIKKAEPVATQSSSSASTTASLVPTVLGLIGGIQQMNAKQKELTNECIPSSQEIAFVDSTMKEWAKTGAMSAEEVQRKLGRKPCSVAVGGYKASVIVAAGTDAPDICYDFFSGDGNTGMVWYGYPKVGSATYCVDGALSCADKDKKTVSDIYDLFNLIDFGTSDYTAAEATMAAKLMSKIENCSYSKLSAKKRAMWGEFLTDTISGLGQSTSTGMIMEQVGNIAGGGGLGALSSLGAIATQVMGN